MKGTGSKSEYELNMQRKQKNAITFICIVQMILIVLNIVFTVLHIGMVAFFTVVLYIFIYVNYLRGIGEWIENGNKSGFFKNFRIISPILFFLTFLMAIFSNAS